MSDEQQPMTLMRLPAEIRARILEKTLLPMRFVPGWRLVGMIEHIAATEPPHRLMHRLAETSDGMLTILDPYNAQHDLSEMRPSE